MASLKQHLTSAQKRMKLYADAKRLERVYQVLLKLQPYAQATVINRPYPKLAYKFFRLYIILECIGQVADKIELPPNCKVHNVFHVSQLKDFGPDYSSILATLPDPPEDVLDTEPEKILERRLVKKGIATLP
jgi:hypothetical protein